MPEILFTQFVRPNGRRVQVRIDRPAGIADKAEQITAAGYRFECEALTTGHVSLTIANDDGDAAIKVVRNGPDVPAAVDALIRDFRIPEANHAR